MTVSEKSWEGGRVQVTTEGGRVVEHRTTASDGRFCEQCGRPLTGRKERWCSDRCRMRVRRADEAARQRELLGNMRQALSALEAELVPEVEV